MTTARRRASTKRMHDVRPLLEERSAGFCEVCAAPLHPTDGGYEAAHHHRQLRTRGGNDGPENALLCHHQCHAAIHSRPKRSLDLGHMVASWDDPAHTQLIYQGRPALLAADGQVIYQDEEVF